MPTTAGHISIFSIYRIIVATLFLLLVIGCTSPSRLISWKDPNKTQTSLSKVLVVGVIHDSLLEVRKNMEDYFVNAFKAAGYNAEASLDAFGKHTLARLDQENTYLNLCNQGIDAVLTIALLNEKKATKYHDPRANKNTSAYYYNRIVNYRDIRAKPKDHIVSSSNQTQFIWETTLFNLSTLTPLYWAQTQPFAATSTKQNHQVYGRIILNNLQKLNVLNKRP